MIAIKVFPIVAIVFTLMVALTLAFGAAAKDKIRPPQHPSHRPHDTEDGSL